MILRHGDKGIEVKRLQRALVNAGVPIAVDGWYGDKTENAVIRFQRSVGLFVDGIAGIATMNALSAQVPPRERRPALTENDIKKAARKLGVQVATIKAVTEVESRHTGFLSSGRPVILFERHVMYRRLPEVTRNHLTATSPDVVNPSPGGYLGGEDEWRRLRRASAIDEQTAIESASWGLFQIMGYHWQALGYASVQSFYEQMCESEGAQLEAFVRFIKNDLALRAALKDRDWAEFATRYNGPNYSKNQYDTRLAAAYERHHDIRSVA